MLFPRLRLAGFALALALLGACTHRPESLELANWQFTYQGQWLQATVPGFIHTDLVAQGLAPDPYLGTNSDSLGWVSLRPWDYRTVLPTRMLSSAQPLEVVFEGLAGYAEVCAYMRLREGEWQPCSDTLRSDNMFVRHTLPLADSLLLRADSLCIAVRFNQPSLQWHDSARATQYGIALPDRRAFTRIAPYQQGWDWGPTLPTMGIWKRVYIASPKADTLAPTAASLGITFRQDEDSIGRSFAFYKDGKPIVCKGANWIPIHSFPVDDSANRARYRLLLTSAKEANFNMIRVWGGGIYEHDYFYSLCDSLGLMVWQDFNFSTMLYPDNDEMLGSIRQEVRQNIARIAKHPCVVLWCGNNEVKNGWEDWGWQSVYHWSDAERAALQHTIDTIFGYPSSSDNTSTSSIIAQAVRDCDPLRRPYITTSPLYGWGHPECTTHGDSHYWGVWWGEQEFERYADKTGRFMSEYGFQSYPLASTIRRFCSAADFDINSATLATHQKHPRGRAIIDKAMLHYYGFDSHSLDLEEYAYLSQLLQAWGVGYGILCHLSDPRCAGTLYWQLNDCWPVASWSSIDYYGNWKALHHRAQALFADDADLDAWKAYYAVLPKQRTYQVPRFRLSQGCNASGDLVVSLRAESDLYDLWFETSPHVDGHFSRNDLDLHQGEQVSVRFVPADPSADLSHVGIEVRTLNQIMLRRQRPSAK